MENSLTCEDSCDSCLRVFVRVYVRVTVWVCICVWCLCPCDLWVHVGVHV